MSVIVHRRAMVGYQHQCRARFDVFVATRRVWREATEVFLVASHLASGATGYRQRRARRRGAIDDRERPVGVGPLAQPIGNVHRSGIADNGDDRSRRPEFRRRGGADLRRTTLRRPQAGISLNPAAGIPSVRSAGEVPVADSSTPPTRSSEVPSAGTGVQAGNSSNRARGLPATCLRSGGAFGRFVLRSLLAVAGETDAEVARDGSHAHLQGGDERPQPFELLVGTMEAPSHLAVREDEGGEDGPEDRRSSGDEFQIAGFYCATCLPRHDLPDSFCRGEAPSNPSTGGPAGPSHNQCRAARINR